jgi:hypothetical protein
MKNIIASALLIVCLFGGCASTRPNSKAPEAQTPAAGASDGTNKGSGSEEDHSKKHPVMFYALAIPILAAAPFILLFGWIFDPPKC